MTLKEIYDDACAYRESIWNKAARYGHEPKVYLHWTGGHYHQTSDHYHICITGNGQVYLMNYLDDVTKGTFMRNSGAVNIAICGCCEAGSQSLGTEPPTVAQLEALSQVIVAVCEGLWLTIDKNHVMTHGEAANNEDGYYPHKAYAWWNDEYGDGDTRGDLEYLGWKESQSYNPYATDGSRGGDVLRGTANWYLQEWKKNGFPW